eukprot:jgi/Hompol1/6586/HPOL_000452-RA
MVAFDISVARRVGKNITVLATAAVVSAQATTDCAPGSLYLPCLSDNDIYETSTCVAFRATNQASTIKLL